MNPAILAAGIGAVGSLVGGQQRNSAADFQAARQMAFQGGDVQYCLSAYYGGYEGSRP